MLGVLFLMVAAVSYAFYALFDGSYIAAVAGAVVALGMILGD